MADNMNTFDLQPDPARIVEGLRDTGYDFNTAMADLVDNSIAANATKIKVKVDMTPTGEICVYIADNGCGMDMEGLQNAMRYGSKQREDAASLGKFGLGLKTASTAFCRSLSLLSKSNNSDYNKVQWDLDEICKRHEWSLLNPPVDQDEIDILEDVTGGKSGTLVIWEKVDRLMKTYERTGALQNAFTRLIDNLSFHFSMVYQRFLDKNDYNDVQKIELYLNDNKILPWDPFCKAEAKTQCLAADDIPVQLPDGSKTTFKLEAYILPRVEEFSTSEAKSRAKVNNDMQGFYIYRENRLIHHGDWLKMATNDPHISLLRINFSFDHTLDDAFNVDIKKSRVSLEETIWNYVKESFLPGPRRVAQDNYRKGQTKKLGEAAKTAHDASNANIEAKAPKLENSNITVLDADKGKVQIENTNGTCVGTMKILTSGVENQTRVVPVPSIDNGYLWEPTMVGGKHAVSINQSHPYYSKVYAQILDNSVLVQGLDALLWSLAEAENSTCDDKTLEEYEDMRMMVSRSLKKLVADLPDPDSTSES